MFTSFSSVSNADIKQVNISWYFVNVIRTLVLTSNESI